MPTPTLIDLLAADGVTVKGSGNNWLGLCPFHDDKTSSFNVDPEKGVYFCHGCGAKGNAYQYLTRKRDLTPAEAKAILGESQPRPAADAKPPTVYSSLPRRRIATHEYREADGALILAVCRYADLPAGATTEERRKWRKVDQWTPVDGGWIAKRPKRRTYPLYRLPELLAAPTTKQVMVVEGEKCADTVAAAFPRAVVTAWLGGTVVALKRIGTIDLEPLHGRPVLLVSDTDDTGRKAMRAIAKQIGPHCPNVRLVLPPGDGGADIHDWITNDGVRAAMKTLASLAKDAERPAAPKDPLPPPPSGDGWLPGAFTKAGLIDALGQVRVAIRWNVRACLMEIDRGGGWQRSDALEQADIRELIAATCNVALEDGKVKRALFARESWERCRDAVLRDNQTDPFIESIEALPPWDRAPRIDSLLVRLWGVDATQEELARWASRYPLVGAIQRAYTPGDKLDEFPILVGHQGCGKSVFLKYLLPERCPWFGDGVNLAADVKLFVEQIQGLAIAEVGEMAGLRKAEVEQVKAAVSRTVDAVRLSYRRDPEHLPRRTVFVGTANPGGSIVPNDLSGNRRFVPIVLTATRCLIGRPEDYLDGVRDQLWAEALHRYRDGTRANLPAALAERAFESAEAHRSGNEQLEDAVAGINGFFSATGAPVLIRTIINALKHEDPELRLDAGRATQMEVAQVLIGQGWYRGREYVNGLQARCWIPPVRAADASAATAAAATRPAEPEPDPELSNPTGDEDDTLDGF